MLIQELWNHVLQKICGFFEGLILPSTKNCSYSTLLQKMYSSVMRSMLLFIALLPYTYSCAQQGKKSPFFHSLPSQKKA